jgi:hypothetical protein
MVGLNATVLVCSNIPYLAQSLAMSVRKVPGPDVTVTSQE